MIWKKRKRLQELLLHGCFYTVLAIPKQECFWTQILLLNLVHTLSWWCHQKKKLEIYFLTTVTWRFLHKPDTTSWRTFKHSLRKHFPGSIHERHQDKVWVSWTVEVWTVWKVRQTIWKLVPLATIWRIKKKRKKISTFKGLKMGLSDGKNQILGDWMGEGVEDINYVSALDIHTERMV